MKNVALWGYKPGSNSARSLADSLDIPIIRHENSRFKPRGKWIINWGSSDLFPSEGARIVNLPASLLWTCNKLSFFQHMKAVENGPNIPVFSSEISTANTWLQAGKTVVSRTVLTGHSGNGILITEPGGQLPNAPLYVQYIKKSHEFRVHLFRFGNETRVIDVQRKIRDPDRLPTDWRVRSHANGFIFVRGGFEVPPTVLDQARLAFSVSGLDFGAVDVIWSAKQNKAFTLEINTAPGLSGITLEKYTNAFRELLNGP